MKIISLNIAGCKGLNQRLAKIVDFLNQEDADIVCLQEVIFSDGTNQAEEINDRLDNPYQNLIVEIAEVFTPRSGAPYTEGLAILARVDEVNVEKAVLQPTDKHTRIALNVDLSDGMKISNIHLANNDESFRQLSELLEKLGDNEHFIVGDFNMRKRVLLKNSQTWNDRYRVSVDFANYISCPDAPDDLMVLDYMLLPYNYCFTNIRTVAGLSDHNAIIFEIKKCKAPASRNQ